MNTFKTIFCALAVCSTSVVFAQDKPVASEEEKVWMEYMTPGEQHRNLAASQGLWDETISMWMGPDSKETTMNSTVANKMILGGRYLQGTHKGTFEGMPFEGMSVTGYDNGKKMFFSTWMDNMGTGFMYLEGKYNEELKGIELKGKMFEPAAGKEVEVREVHRIVDENNHTLEMYITPPGGNEYKNMQIAMVRKKVEPSKGIHKDPSELPQKPGSKTEGGPVKPPVKK